MLNLIALAVLAANPTNINSVVASAKPGDTITLAQGSYDPLVLPKADNMPSITIDASQADLASVYFRSTNGWTISGGHTGARAGHIGYSIDGSKRIKVSHANVEGIHVGMAVFRQSQDIELSDNTFRRQTSDGIDLTNSQGIRVLRNSCADFTPEPLAHPDCVQMWTRAGSPTLSDVVIDSNVATGMMQGINLFDHGNPQALNISVTNNNVTVGYWWGIALANIKNAVVTGNVVKTLPNSGNRATARLTLSMMVDPTFCGNVITSYPKALGQQACPAPPTPCSALPAAIAAAHGGDTITVAPGQCGPLVISKAQFDKPVTIRGGTYPSVTVVGSKGVTLDGITVAFKPDANTRNFYSAIGISGSSNVSLLRSTITGGPAVNGVPPEALVLDASGNVLGWPAARAVTLTSNTDTTISGNVISFFHKGVVINSGTGFVIDGNDIGALRTTPISGGPIGNITITNNHLHDSTPWRFGGTGDHGDFIHLWTLPAGAPVVNVTIAGNFLDQGTHFPMLGIYLDDNMNKVGFRNVLIEQNVVSNNNAQAIRLENVIGTVRQNSLVMNRDGDYHAYPGVLVAGGSAIDLSGNIYSRLSIYPGATAAQSGNVTVLRPDYPKLFVNGLAVTPGRGDFARLPGVTAGAN